MKKNIFSNMMMIAVIAVCLTTILLSGVTYYNYTNYIERGVRDEARYMATSINLHEDKNLDAYRNLTITRITIIQANGEVSYDSTAQEKNMHNHKNRSEFKQALKKGTGQITRMSPTMKQQTYYYAIRLKDGNVLRLSRQTKTILQQFMGILPYSLLVVLFVLFLDFILSRALTDRIVEPINKMDLVHPTNNDTYRELRPLLNRIDEQNQNIEEQFEELKKAGNLRKEFSANVSHELKTPLTTISGYAELMKDGLVKPEDMKRFSGTIYSEAKRLIDMVESIIKISKLDEQKIELRKEPIDLYEMAFQIKNALEHKAQKEQITVHIRGLHTMIQGARQIIYELMYNIVENGIKYNHPGGKVAVTLWEADEHPTMIIEDDGMGIAKDDLDRIFERFYRADKSHSSQKEGSGLGLAIVKHGVDFHNATIDVNSEEGKGTKITIVFPKYEANPE